VWHLILTVVIAAALVVQLVLLFGGGTDVNAHEAESVGIGARLLRFFSYFTIQSNILALVGAVSLAIDPDRDGRLWRVVRLDGLLGIVITGVVYATLLSGLVALAGIDFLVNGAFHYFAPWWTLLGWLLFGPRPRIDWASVRWAFLWPVLWVAYAFLHGALSDWYPYPFLDVAEVGYPTALRNTGVVLLAAVLLALGLKALDGRLPDWRGHPRVVEDSTRGPR
jgi:hypothetical protein